MKKKSKARDRETLMQLYQSEKYNRDNTIEQKIRYKASLQDLKDEQALFAGEFVSTNPGGSESMISHQNIAALAQQMTLLSSRAHELGSAALENTKNAMNYAAQKAQDWYSWYTKDSLSNPSDAFIIRDCES